MKTTTIQKIVLSVLTFATIGVNALATTLPLNGKTTKELSDAFPVYFVPAGYVFSIWGIIYLGLILTAIYYWLPKNESQENALRRIFPLHAVGLMTNAAWIFAWHYQQVAISVVIMLILLVGLAKIYQIVHESKIVQDIRFKLMVKWPFGIYLGWISVATITNVTVFLYSIGIASLILLGAIWAAILMVIAGALAMTLINSEIDLPYAGVIIWALMGIMVKFPAELLINIVGFTTICGIIFRLIWKSLRNKLLG